jgi:Cornifin (SPRR) family
VCTDTAMKDCDPPDVRDRAYVYWRLPSIDPGAEKVSDLGAEKVSDPRAEKVSDPGAEKVSDPRAEKVSDPRAKKVSDPGAEKVSDPGSIVSGTLSHVLFQRSVDLAYRHPCLALPSCLHYSTD